MRRRWWRKLGCVRWLLLERAKDLQFHRQVQRHRHHDERLWLEWRKTKGERDDHTDRIIRELQEALEHWKP